MTSRSVAWDWGVALAVTALVVVAGTFANRNQPEVTDLGWFGYLLLVIGPAALIWRRVHPVPVFWFVLGICLAFVLGDYGYGPIFLALIVAFLTAGTSGSRWWTYPFVPFGFLLLVWPVPALLGSPAHWVAISGVLAWLTVLVLIAEGIRQRRAVLEARRQRAEAARRDEQAQRQRAASEERLAIARELHDVLAHSLSLINVQSSVALELFDRKPEKAAAALAAIKTASREALSEVHTLLHTIRAGGPVPGADTDTDSVAVAQDSTEAACRPGGRREPKDETAVARPAPAPAPRAPTPTIEDLDELLQRARAAGLTVTTRVLGTTYKLPSVIDVAAARIIQESLTNVARHAPGADAQVTVRYTSETVDITVDNTRPTGTQSRSGTGGGNGIIGMRERAHALGGALTAGPRPSGGFRVAARLPARTPVRQVADPAAQHSDSAS